MAEIEYVAAAASPCGESTWEAAARRVPGGRFAV